MRLSPFLCVFRLSELCVKSQPDRTGFICQSPLQPLIEARISLGKYSKASNGPAFQPRRIEY